MTPTQVGHISPLKIQLVKKDDHDEKVKQ